MIDWGSNARGQISTPKESTKEGLLSAKKSSIANKILSD